MASLGAKSMGPSVSGSIVASAIGTLLAATLAVGVRFYTRVKIVRVLGIEDWTILAALVSRPALSFWTKRAQLTL
jgi:hypothetical protein